MKKSPVVLFTSSGLPLCGTDRDILICQVLSLSFGDDLIVLMGMSQPMNFKDPRRRGDRPKSFVQYPHQIVVENMGSFYVWTTQEMIPINKSRLNYSMSGNCAPIVSKFVSKCFGLVSSRLYHTRLLLYSCKGYSSSLSCCCSCCSLFVEFINKYFLITFNTKLIIFKLHCKFTYRN